MTTVSRSHLAQAAYGTASAPVRTPRGAEYAVFAQVTRRMKQASLQGKLGFPELARALHENQRLWTILATDVASDGNELPRSLRAQILGLALFTRTHSANILQGTAGARPLIEINVAIMKGLATQKQAA